jgi:ATP-dependent DNA helicase 2 subunit 2
MADKEATVYVIDLARSMGKKHSGRAKSDLEWSLEWVYDKITGVVFTGRKTLQIGVLGLGTDGTDHAMGDDESYRHISVLQPISQILLPELQKLPTVLKPSATDDRDIISAIILAVDMINRHCKHLKYKKKVIVVTNALGSRIDEDDTETVAQQFKDNDIELVVLGVDFDDPEYGVKEEDKPKEKEKNEMILRKLVDLSDGQFGTMQEAMDGLSRPAVKAVRPTPTYRGQLRLGDPTQYDTALYIDVERYMKVSVRRPPTASAHIIRPSATVGEDENPELTGIHNLYKYKVKGDQYPDGVKILERDELAKGYEYGRTAVSIAESEQNITKYETESAYDILGFIPADNVERYMLMDNASVVVAQKGNDRAALALSSLIHALFELGSVAIGRLVKKDLSEPILTVLSPLVEPDFEGLIENTLPFAEDQRSYRFPPLDKVLTVSGKALAEHRNLPSKRLLDNMSNFVDHMMLVDEDDGGEIMAIEDTFSPSLHSIEDAIKDRAVNGSDPKKGSDVPKRKEVYELMQRPPPKLVEEAGAALEKLKEAADVKKVKKEAKMRTRDRALEKPLSGLDIDALLKKARPAEGGKTRIDPANAVSGFKQFMDSQPSDMADVEDVVRQMQTITEDLVRESFGDRNYARVVEMLATVRKEMVELEMPDLYNQAIRMLKEKIFSKQLGGSRRDLWAEIRREKTLGLITHEESSMDVSQVTKDDAEEFMQFAKDE